LLEGAAGRAEAGDALERLADGAGVVGVPRAAVGDVLEVRVGRSGAAGDPRARLERAGVAGAVAEGNVEAAGAEIGRDDADVEVGADAEVAIKPLEQLGGARGQRLLGVERARAVPDDEEEIDGDPIAGLGATERTVAPARVGDRGIDRPTYAAGAGLGLTSHGHEAGHER
jgi:hypothetical protein